MRDSLIQFLKVCIDVKVFLRGSCFELHYHEDGSYADFKKKILYEPNVLNSILQGFEYSLFSDGDNLVIRVYENYEE